MDLTPYKTVLEETREQEKYFEAIDFPRLAESFKRAADSMKELMEVLEKVNSGAIQLVDQMEECKEEPAENQQGESENAV